MSERWRIEIRGKVQGIGLRPYLYRCATALSLTGEVCNSSQGAVAFVQGNKPELETFLAQVQQGPHAAGIEQIVVEPVPLVEECDFRVAESRSGAGGITHPPVDVAPCAECLAEMNDRQNRRYRYPFITCAVCGPRLTLLHDLPFDRAATSMREFPLCDECQREYGDPQDRRFHAQTLACPRCGPELQWIDTAGDAIRKEQALEIAQGVLRSGGIVAVKGVGGFHFVCDATCRAAVDQLRQAKGRGEKPFALMARSVEIVRRFVSVSESEEQWLTSSARPIVLLRRRRDPSADSLADEVAPGLETYGFLLPSAPIHELLLDDRPYVFTSGNLSGEPLVVDNEVARQKLLPLCAGILAHNRPIRFRCDDSVVRLSAHAVSWIRKSRGDAPAAFKLPTHGPVVLAIGGDGKSAPALAIGDRVYVAPHVGDLSNWEALTALEQTVEDFCRLFHVVPEVLAIDAHPGYLSHRWGAEYAARRGMALQPVFHHAAHAASLQIDADLGNRSLLAVCFDGTGYGADGTIWGGEFLLVDSERSTRVACLKPVPLPGGDRAVEFPARMALAHLWSAGLPWHDSLPPVRQFTPEERKLLRQQLERGFNAPLTSSIGRLFDAAAALIGLRQQVTYEGEAAIELEVLAGEESALPYRWHWHGDQRLTIDPALMWPELLDDLVRKTPSATLAARFHATVADMLVATVHRLREQHDFDLVGLTGGVFLNQRLVHLVQENLAGSHSTVVSHRQIPCNDGGLAIGQALCARRALVAAAAGR